MSLSEIPIQEERDGRKELDLGGLVEFVSNTREHVFLRECDRCLILRPNKVFRLNETAFAMMSGLYTQPDRPDPWAVAHEIAEEYETTVEQSLKDMLGLGRTVLGLLREDLSETGYVRKVGFDARPMEWPILSEIALTYGCQARCRFCYASAPGRKSDVPEMTPDEVEEAIRRIAEDAHCPSLSFSGGEPTLVWELPRYVAYAKSKGLRVNLITNGIRCAEPAFVEALAEAGLDSAQVSLEAGSAERHDDIVGRPGSFADTVRGIRNLRAAGIHTHTNTTICGPNKDHLSELIRFLREELESQYFSMNIVIRTGESLGDPEMDIRYSDLGEVVPPVFELAQELGIKPVWYSPTPLCVFNPLQYGIPSSTCACCESLLSLNPAGDVLPCSSFETGVGNLLEDGFEAVWRSPRARYWREKQAAPPGCSDCPYYPICFGACPLYWDDRGGFDEIDPYRPGRRKTSLGRGRFADWLWSFRRRTQGRVYGVGMTTGCLRGARRR